VYAQQGKEAENTQLQEIEHVQSRQEAENAQLKEAEYAQPDKEAENTQLQEIENAQQREGAERNARSWSQLRGTPKAEINSPPAQYGAVLYP